MVKSDIVKAIDQAMAALKAARKELADRTQQVTGRTLDVGPTTKAKAQPTLKKHTMSEGGRLRIAAAQRKRWAAQKKSAKKAARAKA